MTMNDQGRKGFYKPGTNYLLTNKKVVPVILILLILFFGLQFFSQLFLNLGKGKEEPANTGFLKWSCALFPFEAKPILEYGYRLLRESKQNNDTRMLEESIRYLKKSISVNMLFYNGHLYLGKAYLDLIVREPTIFDGAVAAFKRAARIRGIDNRVSMDTMTIMLSLWPHLNKADREFCTGLFKKSIKRISKEDFMTLLDSWALYCRDIHFFKEGLNKMPQYYVVAARKLGELETDMAARREFLAQHTLYFIAELKGLYQQYQSETTTDLLTKLVNLYNHLDKRVSTYYLEDTSRKKKQKGYLEFKKQVNLDILELLFAEEEWQKNPRLREKLETYIFSYTKELSAMDELQGFEDFLGKKGYFGILSSDLRVFYVKQLLAFKSGQYDSVISDTEKFKRAVLITNSRFIELVSSSAEHTIYLMKNKEVNIRFTDTLYEKIKSYHLLQVLLDGRVIFEEYLSKLVSPLTISVPTEQNYSKHTLRFKML